MQEPWNFRSWIFARGACADEDLEMICLPGATAFVPALVVSGLPNHDFISQDFTSKKADKPN